jgi:hypothetical protein
MRYPSLEEFLRSSERQAFVRYKHLKSWMRKGWRLIDGQKKKTLERANTSSNRRPPRKIEIDPNHRSTGEYREFDTLMRTLAPQYGFDGVFVENVLNEFLPEKLLEYGYRRITDPPLQCFWWQPMVPQVQENEGGS